MNNKLENFFMFCVSRFTALSTVLLTGVVSTAYASTYTVKKGDTLYSIARMNNMSVSEVKALNGMRNNNISVGQVIRLGSGGSDYDSSSSYPSSNSSASSHIVSRGDTLYSIARKYNVKLSALMSANGLTDGNISVGQSLVLPGIGSRVNSSAIQSDLGFEVVDNQFGRVNESFANFESDNLPSYDDEVVFETNSARREVTRTVSGDKTPKHHVVKNNETLYSIARMYNIPLGRLMTINQMTNTNIMPGDRIWLGDTKAPMNSGIGDRRVAEYVREGASAHDNRREVLIARAKADLYNSTFNHVEKTVQEAAVGTNFKWVNLEFEQASTSGFLKGNMDFTGRLHTAYGLTENEKAVTFFQFGVTTSEDSRNIPYIGYVARFLVDPELVLGFNSFFEGETTNGNRRGSFGMDLMSRYANFYANRYIASSGSVFNAEKSVTEQVMDGTDYGVSIIAGSANNIEIGVESFKWTADSTEYKGSSVFAKVGLFNGWSFELERKDAKSGKGYEYKSKLGLDISIDGENAAKATSVNSSNPWDRRYAMVSRDYTIYLKTSTATNPTIYTVTATSGTNTVNATP